MTRGEESREERDEGTLMIGRGPIWRRRTVDRSPRLVMKALNVRGYGFSQKDFYFYCLPLFSILEILYQFETIICPPDLAGYSRKKRAGLRSIIVD